MSLKKISLAISIASGSVSAYAQADNLTPQPVKKTVLSAVTVSASPVHQHEIFEVPSQINTVVGTDKMAAESGSLGQMLEHLPGVNNQSAGTQSGKPVVRGMTGNRVKILSNGQSTDYQAYGTRHLPNVDPYLAERIEVIRGPQSVLYGAEAMGGIVNVIQAELPYGESLSGEAAAEYNSNNRETMWGAKVGVGAKDFAIQAGLSTRSSDHFTVPNTSIATGTIAEDSRPLFVGDVPFTNFENTAANVGIGYQQDWGAVALRHTQWLSKQNYLGIDDNREALPAGQQLQNDETQLKVEWFLENDWVVKPSYTHTRNAREASHDLPYESMAEDKGTPHYLDLLVKRDDVKLALEHPKMGDFKGELGFDLSDKQQDLRSGELTPSAKERKRAVYLFEEAKYDQWLVQVGARYDQQTVSAPLDGNNTQFVEQGIFNGANNRRSFEVFSGSLGSSYRLDSAWTLAANVATGFRAPSIFELYAGGEHGGVQAYQVGNPNLKAETSFNTDLSLRWQTTKSQMMATVYQNGVDNYIYLANTGNTVISEAGNRIPEMKSEQTNAVINGFEFSLNHQFNQAWSSDLALEWIQGRDIENHQALPLMPANNVRIKLYYQPQDLAGLHHQKFTVGLKWVDSQNAAGLYEPFSQFDGLPFGTASTDAYTVWNLGYQAQVTLDKQTLSLAASVDNVFDTAYVDFLNTYKGYTLNTGRNFQLKARLEF
ncbi:TonB-dependent receptor [Hydrogenovibrio sp. SC-1]|uniref:TonB-dependent receptor n=1 Tax=Hydrogenovibrio sp. SC-1 TaxID=2065820 RepID=UPI000C7B7E63|nr:TonB-dependent receptor [Hydrogenovibrio sp. SC-1]PLA74556.1 TonB-dependent receptor [Hydrogenovibrio sp. SC-1]